MTLGNRIKKARLAKKWSLETLGEKLGVSRQLVWQWERDTSDARKHIEALCEHLEVPLEYFYGSHAAPNLIEKKILLLTPAQRSIIEAMVDTLLASQEEAPKVRPRRKS